MRLPSLLLLVALPATELVAQGTCRPPKDANESELLAFFAAPIAFSPGGNVTALGAGRVRIGFEATYVPDPSDDIATSEYCYGNKTENTDLTPVFPRPRLALGLGGGWAVEASYIPPVTLLDAKPHLGSIALSRLTSIGGTGLLLRAHATFGQVEGAITCPEDALQLTTTSQPCYGNEASEDTYKPNMYGVEAALTFVQSQRVTGYAGAGYTALRPRFRVGFQDARPGIAYDDTKIVVNMTRIALFGGASFQVGRLMALMFELYSVPEDVTTFRLGASYGWR
ncbi:MAG TPA: hypothetical protein VJ717_20280 [Gemmatimonadaceae bacterium]|nr:hypothetical protein [Gemmatimonadaceae bacterium]